MTLEQRIEEARTYLPDGWRVEINVTCSGVGVSAVSPSGNEIGMDHDETLPELVVRATQFAINHGSKP